MEKFKDLTWIYHKSLSDIKPDQLYKALKLRQDIFIIEQNCIYDDIDGIDEKSEHIFLFDGATLAGYSRFVPAGLKFDTISIGRIVIKKNYRGKGLGKLLLKKSFKILRKNNHQEVSIEAQQHLESFYKSLGFRTISEPYDVDGIDHIKMIKELAS